MKKFNLVTLTTVMVFLIGILCSASACAYGMYEREIPEALK